MNSSVTKLTAFQKPTHLHSHLLFCNHIDQRKKSKRECKPTHPTVQKFSANIDGHYFGQKEGQLVTAPIRNWRLSTSYDSFVVQQTVVLRINICGENRQLLVAATVVGNAKKTS
jgi:hypothetical protein